MTGNSFCLLRLAKLLRQQQNELNFGHQLRFKIALN